MKFLLSRIPICLLIILLSFARAYADPGIKARTFDLKNGLPSNNISMVCQDDKGLIWIGTWNGISFFNGERFYTFRSNDSKGNLSTNRILSLESDSLNNIWLVTYDSKLNLLDKEMGRFVNISEFFPVNAVLPDTRYVYRTKDAIWGVSADGKKVIKLTYNNKASHGYEAALYETAELFPGAKTFEGVVKAPSGDYWIITDKKSFIEGTNIEVPEKLAGIVEADGKSYAVTSGGNLYSVANGQLKAETPLKDFGKVIELVKINNSHLGVATTEGYATYNMKTRAWQTRKINGGVTKIFVDSNNRVWLFAGNGDILMAAGTGNPVVMPFEHDPKQATTFVTPLIYEDRFGTVWLAQEKGHLGHYDESRGMIVGSPVILPNLRYKALPTVEKYFIDKSGNMWVISPTGLSFVNFTYHNLKNIPVEDNLETRSVLVTRDGTLLAGSVSGVLAKYTPDGKLQGYLSIAPAGESGGRLVISPDNRKFSYRIYALHEDAKGNIWVGTKERGLYTITPDGRVLHYDTKQTGAHHFPSDVIYGFDTDGKGRLWAATYDHGPILISSNPDGSTAFTPLIDLPQFPKDESFKQVRRITHNADGLIVMSTNAGLLTFKDNFKNLSDIKFTVLEPDLNNGESLSTANAMQTLFTKYGYALVAPMGGEVQGIDLADLAAGRSKFRKPASEELSSLLSRSNVQSLIDDNEGNLYFVRDTDIVRYSPSDSTINILGNGLLGDDYEFTEGQPTKDAKGNLYFPALGTVVKLDPKSISKLTDHPSIIFTSMETPEKGRERILIPTKKIVIKPGDRDFSISFTSTDYMGVGHTEYAYRFGKDGAWTYIGTDNTLRISGLTPGTHRLYIKCTNSEGTWGDGDAYVDIDVKPRFGETIWAKLLWILFALILIGAVVWIYNSQKRNRLMNQMRQREHDFYVNASHRLRTPLSLIGSPVYEVLKTEQLSDVGREHLERVRRSAKNMLQVLNSMLEKEFKGSGLYDKDTVGDNSSFSDPLNRPSYMTSENWLEVKDEEQAERKQDITILIVEDNDDLRGFLRDILQSRYNILTAANGKEGLAIAESGQPDFILTDVTMPEMDGLTMVKKIKSHQELSHIPIIVLSAKTSMADKMEGLRVGIDDYISKPFSATYLRQRIANIIAQRAMLQRTFLEKLGSRMNQAMDDELKASAAAKADSEAPEATPALSGAPAAETQAAPSAAPGVAPASEAGSAPESAPAPEPVELQEYRLSAPQIIEEDHLMMEKLMKFIEEHIADENLKIDDMAEAVGMGRTVFYGKIKAIVGMAPSDFLRTLRMQRAEELIVRSNLTFSQVSFSIGFSDPKYFTKCFKKETGMTPSEYRKLKREAEGEKG